MPARRKRKAVSDVSKPDLEVQQQRRHDIVGESSQYSFNEVDKSKDEASHPLSLRGKILKSLSTQLDSGKGPNDCKNSCDCDMGSSSSDVSQVPAMMPQSDVMQKARLLRTFYDKPCSQLAHELLGKRLVSCLSESGCRRSGIIVETEAYVGIEDKAAHSYGGKRTARNEAMFMSPGTAYVYNIYGIYTCINISSQGDGAAVLIRALEPTEGLAEMHDARTIPGKEKKLKDIELGNGPSKLTKSLNILKSNGNQVDLTVSKYLWLEDGVSVAEKDIVSCSRIGIANYAEDWTHKPLRYYIFGNRCVSVRDKRAEVMAGLA